VNSQLIRSNDIAEPTVEAFTSIISGYADRGDVDAADRILKLMSLKQIQANAYTITSLMTACLKANNLLKAKSILDNQQMMNSLTPIEKSLVHGSYVAGLCSLASNDYFIMDVEKLQLLYQAMFHLLEMDYLGIQSDVSTINAVIKAVALCLPNGIEIALGIYRAMIYDKISPDEFSYSIMLSALGRDGYTAEALQLCEAAVNSGVTILDTVSINSLLKAFADGANPLQAVLLYLELTSSSRSSSPRRTFNSLQFDRQKWTRLEFVPNQATFSIMFAAIMRSGVDKASSSPSASSSGATMISPAVMRSIYATLLAEKVHVIKANSSSQLASFIRRLIIENYRSSDISNGNKQRKAVELSASATQNIKLLENMGPSTILNQLYRHMRFEYNLEPDAMLVSTLKSLFSSSMMSSSLDEQDDPASAILSTKLWFGFQGYDEDTARLVFEDLITLGIHPKDVSDSHLCCCYVVMIADVAMYLDSLDHEELSILDEACQPTTQRRAVLGSAAIFISELEDLQEIWLE
jgi:pentatricopeptide repeat protein